MEPKRRKKPGPKPMRKSEVRSHVLGIALNRAEWAAIRKAAKPSPTVWARTVLLEAAKGATKG